MELLEPFGRLLRDMFPTSVVRAIEAGESYRACWTQLDQSGFLDALIPEAEGGSGLSIRTIAPLLIECGRHASPLPIGETMVARALLAADGVPPPPGAITLLGASAAPVPFGRVAEYVLVGDGDRLRLFAADDLAPQPTGVYRSLAARISIHQAAAVATIRPSGAHLAALGAVITAAAMAGLADTVLNMTVAYANARSQFGKPIGRQQAIQQQLAVMAELSVAAGIAAQIGCAAGMPVNLAAAAVAKYRTSAIATLVADIAHAVHGAIGISEELDLQLFTRRLREARLAYGSEGHWAKALGESRLAQPSLSSVDFIRSHIVGAGRALQ